jgi:CheY-like chemotaxis protein
VEDSGTGIAQEQLESIFLPFQQVGQNRYVQQGTGLGLSITQQLIKVMGGALHVESIEHEGSIFWFDLDLPGTVTVPQKMEEQYPEVVGYKGRQLKILVTDDTRENRSLITNMLLPLGFEILEAENGKECFEIACCEKPDAILLDLLMPVMDGFESAGKIRENPDIQQTPIIAISASVFEDTVNKSLEAGCDAFLLKPLELHTLLDCLHTHLQVEWIYQEEKDSAESSHFPRPSVSDSVQLLTSDHQQELRKWAECGNITRLLEFLGRLEELGEEYLPIATEFRKYTKSFQIHRILTYLDRMEVCNEEEAPLNTRH